MKYNFVNKIITAISFCSIITSCSDFLNLSPVDEVSDAIFWNDNESVRNYVNGLYETFNFPKGWWGKGMNELGLSPQMRIDSWSDDVLNLDVSDVPVGTFTNTFEIYGDGAFSYGRIRRTNIAIENIDKLAVNLTEKEKNIYIAEAKFVRAYLYFQKVRYFGGIPIIDKIMTTDDELNLPRNTEEECMDFIIKDLDFASKNLPDKWSGSDWGRATAGAALALKARAELHAGLFDDCISTTEEIFKLNCYDLEPEYGDLFNNPTTFLTSKETIFALQCKYPGNGNLMQLMMTPNVESQDALKGWGTPCPTQNLVDDYYVKDIDGKAKKWNETTYFSQNYPTKGVSAMYDNRDKRFYATVIYNGCEVRYRGYQPCIANLYSEPTAEEKTSSWVSGYAHNSDLCSPTGYAPRKFMYIGDEYPSPNFSAEDDRENHYIYLRFGEVLLNYAEALLEKDRIDDAKAQLNRIRERTGLPPYSSITFEDYMRERRVELAYEGHRYFDLIRWAKNGRIDPDIPELNKTPNMIKIHGSSAMTYDIVPVEYGGDRILRKFEAPKRYYFPIPYKEIMQNPELKQNEYWDF